MAQPGQSYATANMHRDAYPGEARTKKNGMRVFGFVLLTVGILFLLAWTTLLLIAYTS